MDLTKCTPRPWRLFKHSAGQTTVATANGAIEVACVDKHEDAELLVLAPQMAEGLEEVKLECARTLKLLGTLGSGGGVSNAVIEGWLLGFASIATRALAYEPPVLELSREHVMRSYNRMAQVGLNYTLPMEDLRTLVDMAGICVDRGADEEGEAELFYRYREICGMRGVREAEPEEKKPEVVGVDMAAGMDKSAVRISIDYAQLQLVMGLAHYGVGEGPTTTEEQKAYENLDRVLKAFPETESHVTVEVHTSPAAHVVQAPVAKPVREVVLAALIKELESCVGSAETRGQVEYFEELLELAKVVKDPHPPVYPDVPESTVARLIEAGMQVVHVAEEEATRVATNAQVSIGTIPDEQPLEIELTMGTLRELVSALGATVSTH